MTTPKNEPKEKPQQQQQQAPQQEAPRLSILESKTALCATLRAIFMRELMMERLLKMAGGDESRVAKYMTGFFAVIMQDDGGSEGNKKYYFQCVISSLVTCFLESVNMQLPFDSRKLVSMIIYKNGDEYEAELDISYKGFVNALNRHFTNAFVECKLVFEKDVFITEIVGRTAKYTFKPNDAFAVIDKDFKGIKGGYCFFSYTDKDNNETSRLVFLSRDQIMKNRSRARTKSVWDSDPKAMGEKTCIREGARLPFASIDLEVDIEAADNKHYQLDKPDAHLRLKHLVEAQEADLNPKPKEGDDGKTPKDATVGNTPNGDAGQVEQQNAGGGDAAPAQGEAAAAANPTGGEAVVSKEPAHVETVSSEKQPDPNQAGQQVLEPAKSETTPGAQAAVIDATYEEMAQAEAAGQREVVQGFMPVWDGKSVYMGGGKSISKDNFASSQQAAVYLKKVIGQRTKKETRREILDGNPLLVAALERDGNTAVLEDLNKIANEGE